MNQRLTDAQQAMCIIISGYKLLADPLFGMKILSVSRYLTTFHFLCQQVHLFQSHIQPLPTYHFHSKTVWASL